MFRRTVWTISAATAIIVAAIGTTASTGLAGVTSSVDQNRGYQLAMTAGHDQTRRGLRVINRRCAKYLLQFQRTGNEYFLRVYRDCVNK